MPDRDRATGRRRSCHALLALATASVSLAASQIVAAERSREFWLALAQDCDVPAGESAYALVKEATSFLGSPDPVWRDDIGYGVVAACVYQQRRLDPDQRRVLVATLTGNLRQGIDQPAGGDATLLRTFSALDLSIFAALELQVPALDANGYRQLLDAAFAYLRDERDLRGLDERVGWVHATAHTADLLKFLARDPRFTPADQGRLLDAAWERMTLPGTPVFTHAEDERLAAAIVSAVRRDDFDAPRFESWLDRFGALEARVWERLPPQPATLDASQNSRNLLRSLHVALSFGEPEPTPQQAAARDAVLGTREQIRR